MTDKRRGQWLGAASFGFRFFGVLLLGAAAGWAADRRFDTAPLFILVGVLGGVVAGLYGLYRAGAQG